MTTVRFVALSILAVALAACVGAEQPAAEDNLGESDSALISYYTCGEASCVHLSGAYVSHYTGAGCTGTEAYYTPYFSGTTSPNPDGMRRSWDGLGIAGTSLHTFTVRSYRGTDGRCINAWPSGNTLANLVVIYRTLAPAPACPPGYTLRSGVWYMAPGYSNYYGTTYASSACVGPASAPTCANTVDPITGRIDSFLHADYQTIWTFDARHNPTKQSPQFVDVCEDPTDNNYIASVPCPGYLIAQWGVDQCADLVNITP